MLEVRKEDNGVWVGNGRKRVWVSSNMLDTYDTIVVSQDNSNVGEVVYTHKDPLIAGERYSGKIINENASHKMIIINIGGNAYQYFGQFGGWLGLASDRVQTKLLDDSYYTLVWKGDERTSM